MKCKAGLLLNHDKVNLTRIKQLKVEQFNTSCAGLQVELKQSCWWLSGFAPLNICCGVTVLWAEEKMEPKSNPGLWLFSLMSLCALLFTNEAHVCSMSVSSSHRHSVWSTQDKASGVHVERNVLVKLQTWQSGLFSHYNLKTNRETSKLR